MLDQKSHEYKVTWKITLKPQHNDGVQLITSRSYTTYNVLYIFSCRGCYNREWLSDWGIIPCLSADYPLEVLASHSVIGAFLVLTFQYATPRAILVPGMLMETENIRTCRAKTISYKVTNDLKNDTFLLVFDKWQMFTASLLRCLYNKIFNFS